MAKTDASGTGGPVGVAELMVDVRNSWQIPLTTKTFFSWHRMLLEGNRGIQIGAWRTHEEYFESIHPFEDGNGRIGRAIAEKALSQGIGRPVLLSLSEAIDSGMP